MRTAAPTGDIPWHLLSPRARATLKHVALRLTAGFSFPEIAEILDADRPPELSCPPGRPVTPIWLRARMKELRTEIRAVAGLPVARSYRKSGAP